MAYLDYENWKKEFTRLLRNGDVLTITERNVTTDTVTGTFSAASSLLINRNNAKNVRSVVVASVTLTPGQDYTYDLNYVDGANIKLNIAFTSPQTGAYTIIYDYGEDRIFDDFADMPTDLDKYPRISWEDASWDSEDAAAGGATQRSDCLVTIVIYAKTSASLTSIVRKVRERILATKKTQYYAKYLVLKGMGPVLSSQRSRERVIQRNIDVSVYFDLEG